MRIALCVKPIPDPELVQFDIHKEKFSSLVWGIYSADLGAMEEALRIKERFPAEISVFSVSPPYRDPHDLDALQAAYFYGADRVVRLWDLGYEQVDGFTAGAILAEEIKDKGFDLIICGDKSGDTGDGYFGAVLAECLHLPLVTGVVNIEIKKEQLILDKKLERGYRETYDTGMPAVVTVDESINNPRYVALLSKAYQEGIKKEIENKKIMEQTIKNDLPNPCLKVSQWKPRTKGGKDISGLSMTDMMKMLRGEKGDKKEIFSGPSRQVAQQISDTLIEWLS